MAVNIHDHHLRERNSFDFYSVLHPSRCLSSKIMSHVNSWRNERERDVCAFDTDKSFSLLIHCNDHLFRLRLLVAQCAYYILFFSSSAEFMTYLALSIITIPWRLVDSRLHKKLGKLNSSAYVTVVWSINNFVFNVFTRDLVTFESFARIYYRRNFSIISGDLLGIYSYHIMAGQENSHQNFIYNWLLENVGEARPPVEDMRIEIRDYDPLVSEGRGFMREILKKYDRLNDLRGDLDEGSFGDHFQMVDALAINWVLKATILELVYENSSKDPRFLRNIHAEIDRLRRDEAFQGHLRAITENLEVNSIFLNLFKLSLDEFDRIDIQKLDNEDIQYVFRTITQVASLENQGSTYLTACWGLLLQDPTGERGIFATQEIAQN